VQAAAGKRGVETFACLMDPGAATVQSPLRIGHDPTTYGSEAMKYRLRGALTAPHAATVGDSPLYVRASDCHGGPHRLHKGDCPL
jgi:hypothetical protein